jgi:hypothetical protein
MAVTRSHYDVLGVRPSASPAEVRSAYLRLARESHPDRYVDAGPIEHAAAERRMQEITEAWRVVGDAGRRRRYDRDVLGSEREPAEGRRPNGTAGERAPFAMRADGTAEEYLDHVDATARLVRALPWVLVMAVLALIFVFTAYAVTGDGPGAGTATLHPGDCVLVDSGPMVRAATCGSPGARVIDSIVAPSSPCPSDTERLQPASGSSALCLEV